MQTKNLSLENSLVYFVPRPMQMLKGFVKLWLFLSSKNLTHDWQQNKLAVMFHIFYVFRLASLIFFQLI
jgi:hypothetical protein